MKRSRGRGGRKPNIQLNRTFDSNGPDVKIRGSALQIYEKYQTLARDAQSSGDHITAENYLQHAEHYYRVLASMQQALQQQGFANGDRGPNGGPHPNQGQNGNYRGGQNGHPQSGHPQNGPNGHPGQGYNQDQQPQGGGQDSMPDTNPNGGHGDSYDGDDQDDNDPMQPG